MYCSHCGNELAEGARFCAVCGTQTTAKAPDIAAISANASDDASGGVSAALASGRSRSRLRITPLILLILVLALTSAVAAASYYVYTQVYLPSVERGSYAAYAPDDEIDFSEPLKTALMPQVDLNEDGRIVYSEVEATTKLVLSDPGITDVSELAVFTNIESLNLNGTSVNSADLSNMAGLASIDAADVPLESLNVSGNAQLSRLACRDEADVVGIEDTQLAERWLMTSCRNTGLVGDRKTIDGTDLRQSNFEMNFEYDDAGHLVRRTLLNEVAWAWSPSPMWQDDSVTTYSYNNDKCVKADTSTTWTDYLGSAMSESSSSTVDCEYDDHGRLTRAGMTTVSYTDDGVSSIEGVSAYASESSVAFENGDLTRASSIVQNGRPVSAEYSGDLLAAIGNERYSYTDDGVWCGIEATGYGLDRSDYSENWSFDEQGRIISGSLAVKSDYFAQYNGGQAPERIDSVAIEYDTHGNIVTRRLIREQESVMEFSYSRAFVPKSKATDWQPVSFGAGPFNSPQFLEPWEQGLVPELSPLSSYIHEALMATGYRSWGMSS